MSANAINEPIYEGVVTSKGGRAGRVSASDESFDLNLVSPKEAGGPGGPGTNPEQLFAAAYAACYESALRAHAKSQEVDPGVLVVTAKVCLGKTEEGKFQLGVTLEADMPGVEREVAERLMQSAHETCPYSRATRGNVEVDLVVR